ncbi:rhodanese family protein [Francisellaceae bacterium]|nr:rhodanese family protein [Francisellaceae bacterium]
MKLCKPISPEKFLELKSQNPRLIDIRSQSEHAREKIPGAECIPMEQISENQFDDGDIVVFHCQSGNRTQQAQKIISQLDCKETYILEGGMGAWKSAGQSTEIDTKAPLPLMRQVQIIVGFMVLVGIVLSYLISPYFNLLSAFFGAGLLFAGLSGYCGLANVLMLLPYNKSQQQ